MRWGVLGPLEVWTADGAEVRVPELKIRALLAHLLAHRGRPVSADRLIEDLWGGRLPRNPQGVLQTKVWQLRRVLETAEPGGRSLVVSRTPGYALHTAPGTVDADRFQDFLARARSTAEPRARAALLADALALWRGPAFTGFADEEFARPSAARLDEQRLTAVEEQAELRLELDEHALLADELSDLVALHPLRERMRAAHLRALWLAGRQGEALRGYTELRTRLADDLGVDPGPELTALHRSMLAQDRAPAARPAPVTTAARRPGNLPAPLTGLIGRDEAIGELRTLLGSHRLVTLTGPGGVGKTQLALATAGQLGDSYPGGTHLVELAALDPAPPTPEAATPAPATSASATPAPATSAPTTTSAPATTAVPATTPAPATTAVPVRSAAGPDAHTGAQPDAPTRPRTAVADAVGAVLGLRDDASLPAGRPPELAARVARALGDRPTLLLLDNCEHVAVPVAELAAHLLKEVPTLRILATSQVPLGLTGERLEEVRPLRRPADTTGLTPEESREFSAVELFVARATASAPRFTFDADSLEAVVSICRRLDGIPLALEMAATRVRALGVHELDARLDDRFHLLRTGSRDAPARQRTLRAVIDWSWELLGPREQAVLRRLAVHADGCTLAAAEELCAGDGVDPEDVLDLLARLVDGSLLLMTDSTRSGDGPRYRMLESVAAYATAQLARSGETAALQQRHRAYYTSLAERAEPHLRGPDQRHWLRRLDAEHANLRSALDGALRTGDTTCALRLVNALAWYWNLRGRNGEARRSLTQALSAAAAPASEGVPAALVAQASGWLGGFRLLLSGSADPVGTYREALQPYEDVDDPLGRARAQWFVASNLYGIGDPAPSSRLIESALSTFRSLGDRWGTAAALASRSFHAQLRGDLDAQRRYGERSLDLFQELGDQWGRLQAMVQLQGLAEVTGDYERAGRLRREGLRIAEDLELWPAVSFQLSGLGRIALLTRDHPRARQFHERARRLAVTQSDRFGEQYAEVGLGMGARRTGDLHAAEAHLRRVLEIHRQMGYEPEVPALILAELGFVAELRGEPAAALKLQLDGVAAARGTGARSLALALEGVAGARALTGGTEQAEHAALLLGAAAAARRSVGTPLPEGERDDVARIEARARTVLDAARFDAAYARGEGIPPADILRHPALTSG
ncbi:BTAD domain-containing putative transcriptional regulator [Streptomyces sp. NPDC058657]|uniref:BTAD domain-containing putative transcriptional regulator n=1 Tax=unclassified Streptomyces TaxID=2593676 RepID=UPI00366284F3